MTTAAAACALSFSLSLAGCTWLRAFAIRRALVDRPNERSLHTAPVPRLGGVGLAVGVWAVALAAGFRAHAATDVRVWLLASFVTAATGLVDDLRPMSAALRILVQTAVAAALVCAIGSPARVALADGAWVELPGVVTSALGIVWIVGVLNIYNFMDGMDGLAAVQAIGGGIAVAAAFAVHGAGDLALVALLVASAAAGFFLLNVSPARIFLGDAGSTMIGLTFASLALFGQRRPDPVPLGVVPLALAPFLLDGSFTLVRRALRREPVWRAHRTHLYQRAVTSGLSHRDVLATYAGWVAAAGAASALAARASSAATLALAAAMVLGLLAVWIWVLRLEQKRKGAPAPSA